MFLIVQKGIGGGICQAIHHTWNITGRKNQYSLSIGMWIIYTDGQCHRSFPKMILSGLKIYLNLVKILQTSINKIVVKDIFEGDV